MSAKHVTKWGDGVLPVDCPNCGRHRLDYGLNDTGNVVHVKCEKCSWTSDDDSGDHEIRTQSGSRWVPGRWELTGVAADVDLGELVDAVGDVWRRHLAGDMLAPESNLLRATYRQACERLGREPAEALAVLEQRRHSRRWVASFGATVEPRLNATYSISDSPCYGVEADDALGAVNAALALLLEEVRSAGDVVTSLMVAGVRSDTAASVDAPGDDRAVADGEVREVKPGRRAACCAKPIEVGDRVIHTSSGWAGTVMEIAEDPRDDGENVMPSLVTVRPTSPRPKTDIGGNPIGAGWEGWAPITVGEDELEVVLAASSDGGGTQGGTRSGTQTPLTEPNTTDEPEG